MLRPNATVYKHSLYKHSLHNTLFTNTLFTNTLAKMEEQLQVIFYTITGFAYACIIIMICVHCVVSDEDCRPSVQVAPEWSVQGIPLIPKYPHLIKSMNALQTAPKMINWVNKLDKTQMQIKSIAVTDIDWFAANPTPEKLGFVKVSVNAIDLRTNKKIMSNIAFIRGDSVAVLIVVKVITLTNANIDYILLCEQMRVPTGGHRKEICAGMVDANGNIGSVVLKEVEEETGFKIKNTNDLIPLGSIYPSQGGCDEEVFLYAWTTTITEEEFVEKSNRIYGNEEEGEEIQLHFTPLSTLRSTGLKQIKDAKAETAVHRYCAATFGDA
jgi:8-oxo-dGTP pyrophosphatase MutT (NUDIX family)